MKTEKEWTRLSRAQSQTNEWFGKEDANPLEPTKALPLHDVEAAPSLAHESGNAAASEG